MNISILQLNCIFAVKSLPKELYSGFDIQIEDIDKEFFKEVLFSLIEHSGAFKDSRSFLYEDCIEKLLLKSKACLSLELSQQNFNFLENLLKLRSGISSLFNSLDNKNFIGIFKIVSKDLFTAGKWRESLLLSTAREQCLDDSLKSQMNFIFDS